MRKSKEEIYEGDAREFVKYEIGETIVPIMDFLKVKGYGKERTMRECLRILSDYLDCDELGNVLRELGVL